MVLRPMSRAKYCSLALEFSTFQEQTRPPLLVIELANPRFLALFRSAVLLSFLAELLWF